MKRNCECCGASYATGKEYGEYWCAMPVGESVWITEEGSSIKKLKIIIDEPKGLCEFCNPNCEKWYIKDLKCHIIK